MTPEDLTHRLLYRDGLMLVIDKPAGIAVHRGPKGGENLEDYFSALRFGLPRDPALAHRLDRDTSGCLVLGRHRKALERLGKMFRHGHISKTYWAIVEGGPSEARGTIDMPLARLDQSRGWWMRVDPLGQPACTHWQVMGRGEVEERPVTWLALQPVTGRTHQLRVHCAAMGWPIMGDPVYGTAARSDHANLLLHARAISVPLHATKDAVHVEAPAPQRMMAALTACGWQDSAAGASGAPGQD
jgi:tRNA pseudouridine32 synthase/23S rRNA pseudouridine746 synthase